MSRDAEETQNLSEPGGGGTAEPGERVKVSAVDGFRVIVEPLSEKKSRTKKPEKS